MWMDDPEYRVCFFYFWWMLTDWLRVVSVVCGFSIRQFCILQERFSFVCFLLKQNTTWEVSKSLSLSMLCAQLLVSVLLMPYNTVCTDSQKWKTELWQRIYKDVRLCSLTFKCDWELRRRPRHLAISFYVTFMKRRTINHWNITQARRLITFITFRSLLKMKPLHICHFLWTFEPIPLPL